MVRALPSGAIAIAQDAGGVLRLIIQPQPRPPAPEPFDGLARSYIPMLFSGVITSAMVRGADGVGLTLSEMTRRRLIAYDAERELPPKRVRLQRFVIDYNSRVLELLPNPPPTEVRHTQYVMQRPTWYSGAMAEAMQIVGGYGRQMLVELPEDEIERARFQLPPEVVKAIEREIHDVRLPGYSGLPPASGQFQYDYKFNDTNGVGFDPQGKPWLLRVNARGVYAMPFPLLPATTTIAFREYIADVGDDEILAILDRFGGMPSGENFPAIEEDFEAWRRAGVIIKVCDVADFYDHLMYSSACGWSFNTRGTEGYNTCYDYDDTGLGYGLAYKLRLNLGASTADGRLPPEWRREDPVEAALLNSYMRDLSRLLTNTAPHLAIKYKLRRVPVDEILSRAGKAVSESEVEFWDNLELPPMASHSGSVTEVARGVLYHNAIFEFQPQIKFPEPFLGGCVSHDFLPTAPRDSYPNSDTIMFGYYVGDELKVVKYFREGRSYQRDVESDYEDCMTVGSWTQVVTTGLTRLEGHFYTTDMDEREAIAPITETTRIVGRDLGYDSQPHFAQDFVFARPGSLWRNRYFSRKTNVDTTENRSMAIAVCIPYLCRNALLHAKSDTTTGGTSRESTARHAVRDPTDYRYWTHDAAFAWSQGLPVMRGVPYPRDGNPVWVEIEQYAPYPCSDFADQGSWIESLPSDYTWLIHPNKHEWKQSGGGGAPAFNPYSRTAPREATSEGDLRISIFGQPEQIHNGIPHSTYFLGSPDPAIGVFYRDASKVVFGSITYANVMERGEETEGRKRFGYTSLADHRSAHHFIGVINE